MTRALLQAQTGSWLNVAECELSCITRQFLQGRRMGKLNDLQAEIATGEKKTSLKRRGVDWQFNIDDARRKLKRLYPKIKPWQRTRARIIYMEWWRDFNSRFV